MSTWPTIAQANFEYPEEWDDPAIRSEMEGGYTITRPRYTRIRRKWNLQWNAMSGTDYGLLTAFWAATRGGSLSFSWTCVTDGTTKTVRFAAPLKDTLLVWSATAAKRKYQVAVSLEEV
jgi:hypothetical protein